MPSWLPELVNVSPWTQSTYDMLYEIFCRDIRDHNLRYIGNQVLILRDIEYGKEAIFWHLTTRIVKVKKSPDENGNSIQKTRKLLLKRDCRTYVDVRGCHG